METGKTTVKKTTRKKAVKKQTRKPSVPKAVVINADKAGALKQALKLRAEGKKYVITGSVSGQYQLKRVLNRTK